MKRTLKHVLSYTIACILLAVVICCSSNDAFAKESDYAYDLDKATKITISDIKSANDLKSLKPAYTRNVTIEKRLSEGAIYEAYEIKLEKDAWVKLTFGVSNAKEETAQIYSTLYADKAMKNVVKEMQSGCQLIEKAYSGFLNAGTYYMTVRIEQPAATGTGAFSGNIDFYAAKADIANLVTVKQSLSKTNGNVTVSWNNFLGEELKYVEYQPGKISNAYVDDTKYWAWRYDGTRFTGGSDKCVIWTPSKGVYSFKTKKNGTYTIMFEGKDNRYSTTFKVTAADNKAPYITGVKNNKKYKKGVVIRFGDKQTKVASAKLNGKKIKNGYRVKKKGKYTLVVKDVVGNKKKVTFRVK